MSPIIIAERSVAITSVASCIRMDTEQIIKRYTNLPRLYFLTVRATKGSRPRYSKIGFVGDQLRKISDQYFIVRESNKQFEGYHFHAIFSKRDDKPIHKGWYKKGVSFKMEPIGDHNPTPPKIPDEIDREMELHITESMDITERIMRSEIKRLNLKESATIRKHKKTGHIDRVVTYMTKEGGPWLMYDNYILKP